MNVVATPYYQVLKVFDPSGFPRVTLDRAMFLASLVKGKKTLHVGCADWPGTEHRVRSGQLLHLQLKDYASSLIGIDSSSEGIEFLRKAGIRDCLVMDAEQLPLAGTFDVVLAGDVLEHLNNPGLFVARVSEILSPEGCLVIGVPNAFSAADFFRLALGWGESTHHDHTSVHTPKTLTALCSRYGFLPISLTYTLQPLGRGESRAFSAFRNTGVLLFRRLSPSFIMVFRHASAVDQRAFYLWK